MKEDVLFIEKRSKEKLTIEKVINLDEFAFDIIVAIGIFFVGNMIIKQRNITEILGPGITSNVLIVIDFILGYHFGKTAVSMVDKNILKSNESFTLKKLIVPSLYGIVCLYTLFVLWISFPVILHVPGVFTFVLGIIVIILGAMAGLGMGSGDLATDTTSSHSSSQEEKEKKEPNPDKKKSFFSHYLNEKTMTRHPSFILPVLVFLYVLIFIISVFGDSTGLFALLIIVLALVSAIVSIAVSGGIVAGWVILYELISSKVPLLDRIFRKIMVPLFIAVILIIWEHLYLLSVINDTGNIDIGKVIFVLFFTGIIPYRLVMFFKPPVKLANLITGVTAFSFYIYSIRFLA
jgi:hypothetical protein